MRFSRGIIRQVAEVGLARGVSSVGLLVFSLVVSNLWGVAELGHASAMVSLVVGLAVTSRIGLDLLATGVVGISNHRGLQSESEAYLWCATGVAFVLGSALSLLVVVFGNSLASLIAVPEPDLIWALTAVPILSVSSVVGACMRASGRGAIGQVFDIGAFAVVLGAVALTSWLSGGQAFPLGRIFAVSGLLFASWIICASVWHFGRPSQRKIRRGWQKIRERVSELAGLAGLSLTQFLAQWSSVLIAAYLLSPEGTATISVAQRVSMVIFLLLGTTGSVLAPKYAGLYSDGKVDEIKRIEGRVRLGLVIASLPLVLALCFAPDLFLGFFGLKGEAASTCLQLLVLAQFVNVYCGCSPHLLVAVGSGSFVLKATFVGAIFGLTVSFLAAPMLGEVGVAWGQFLGVAVPAVASFAGARMKLRRAPAII